MSTQKNLNRKMLQCRICQDPVNASLTFSDMPIANSFLGPEDFEKEYFFEMGVTFCENCKTFQLLEQPEPQMMFHENYAFFSSTSKKMAEHFEKMANTYLEQFIPNSKEAFVVELGSNDGIMLRHFAKINIKHLGVEPSANVADAARQNGVNSISRFFGKEAAYDIEKEYGKADIISAANVMCHIIDLDSVGAGVDLLLKDTGIFVFEDPYLGDVFKKTSYDQIYDEHVYIFSAMSVSHIFSKNGLEVFRVEPQETHGGSMRYYLCRKGSRPIESSVKRQLQIESDLGLDKKKTFEQFARNCEVSKKTLVNLLKNLKAESKRVVGYAATSKSTTVLNYCDIGPDLVEYICDTTPIKQGKFSPGMHIPIRPYEEFKNDNPDYAILFAWNHAKEILPNEQEFLKKGGKWVVFVPEVKVISSQEEALVYAA